MVRFESPLRAFTRKALQEHTINGQAIPAGARVLVLYASANRDEREWSHPDIFDIRNDAGRHVGFGNGAHACAGQGWHGWKPAPCSRPCSTVWSGSRSRPSRPGS